MIKKQTVFVLGAGASCEYGLPIGTELKRDIVNTLKSPPEGLHKGLPPYLRISQELAEKLSKCGLASIDAFLETRIKFPKDIEFGKKCICKIIAERERSGVRNLGNGWYAALWQKMFAGTEGDLNIFKKNKVSFITFNYDRSLEAFLEQAMLATFGDSKEMYDVLRGIPIIHIYGQIARLPWQQPLAAAIPKLNYGADTDWNFAEFATAGIQVMHEKRNGGNNFDIAKDWLSKAYKVCFLGFGYHRDNLQRLSGYKHPQLHYVIGSYYNAKLQLPREIQESAYNGFGHDIQITNIKEGNSLTDYVNEIAYLV